MSPWEQSQLAGGSNSDADGIRIQAYGEYTKRAVVRICCDGLLRNRFLLRHWTAPPMVAHLGCTHPRIAGSHKDSEEVGLRHGLSRVVRWCNEPVALLSRHTASSCHYRCAVLGVARAGVCARCARLSRLSALRIELAGGIDISQYLGIVRIHHRPPRLGTSVITR